MKSCTNLRIWNFSNPLFCFTIDEILREARNLKNVPSTGIAFTISSYIKLWRLERFTPIDSVRQTVYIEGRVTEVLWSVFHSKQVLNVRIAVYEGKIRSSLWN